MLTLAAVTFTIALNKALWISAGLLAFGFIAGFVVGLPPAEDNDSRDEWENN